MEDERLLLAEYQQYSEAFWRNEDAGERRITFFITLTTALMAAIVAVRTAKADIAPEEVRQIASAALIGAATFGLATFFRIMQRDRVTDEYKAILRYLREQLRRRGTSLDEYDLPFRAPRHWLLRGGLAVTVALMNSFLLAVLTAQWIPPTWRWLVVPAVFLISFAAHAVGIAARKREEEEPSQTFRAGVGAVILNEAGRVLALERRDITGAWQLPQGGLRIGEAPLAAVKREIKEETGVEGGDLHLLFAIDRLLAYELPRSHRSKKTGRGQVQNWFIFRYRGAEERITLGDNKEFRRWKWTTMQDLSSNVVAFKKPVYQELGGFLARELGRGT
jgi:8-oxo-dGTP pyrophosphatase MutT (NUDIX family)